MSHIHIALWSGPRNISTALMYSFVQRSDTAVVDEPLYGHFLSYTGAERPDREATMAKMNCMGDEVLDTLFRSDPSAPVLFTKNIANQMVGLDRSFLKGLQNVILIREPSRVINSYTRQIEAPSELDLAYSMQRELFDFLSERGWPVLVLDSKRVLQDPERQLKTLCERLGIAFDSAMLSWQPGSRPEDGPWAKYWYDSVHRSSGFAPYKPEQAVLPERFSALATRCQQHYDYLVQHALK